MTKSLTDRKIMSLTTVELAALIDALTNPDHIKLRNKLVAALQTAKPQVSRAERKPVDEKIN